MPPGEGAPPLGGWQARASTASIRTAMGVRRGSGKGSRKSQLLPTLLEECQPGSVHDKENPGYSSHGPPTKQFLLA